jgi:hypothetical protein
MRHSEIHTLSHHRCWSIIHTELGRLTSSKWWFVSINGEKNLRTIWKDLEDEFPEVLNFCSVEKIVEDRIWNKRPDGFAIKMPTKTKEGELVILEYKRMSCVTDQYVRRARNVVEAQYVSIKAALERTLGPQGWIVNQRNFHTRGKISEREGLT